MHSLQKKLWRELWHIRGQVLAIMLVIVGGVGVCIMSLTTYDSLLNTRDSYYRDYSFAHVFADLKRAPKSLIHRIQEIPGVSTVETRIIAQINLEVPGFSDPVSGLLTSIPDNSAPRINRLHLVSGRMPDSRRNNELLISDAFAEGQSLEPGDAITAIINGRRREMIITGIALSPEYIYQIAPGSVFPDYQRFGVLWMPEKALANAYGMEGAFNNVVLLLQKGANENRVIDHLDILLDRYGGLGAYGRDDQFSNVFLKEEFVQLKTQSILFPAIFLGVAVFLLNVVITRLVSTQREIVAILKAFGYSNMHIAAHYIQLVLVIGLLGIFGGFILGIYLGQLMTETYADYYRFPLLLFSQKPSIFLGVAFITLLAAVLGSLRAVYRAAALPPAEAMRPEAPEIYQQSWLEKTGLQNRITQTSKMVLRHLQRKPLKTLLSILGLSMASAIMMVGNFQSDSVKLMMHAQFDIAQKQDIEIRLYEPVAEHSLSSITSIPGVYYAEGVRSVAVKLEYGHRSYRTSIVGLPDNSQLQSVLSAELEDIPMPEDGIMVSEALAKKLHFKTGDTITIELLEGKKTQHAVLVSQLSKQFFGMGSYMDRHKLSKILGEAPAINSILISIDPEYADSIYQKLKSMPTVASINLRKTVIQSFYDTLDQILLVFTFINALLGGVIAFGVVYNTVRISLAERGRELASLRVLGYRQTEVAYILFGELAVLTLLSLPLGLSIGAQLCAFIANNLDSDLFRIPLVLSPFTYSFSSLIVILSAMASALLVWRRLHQMDLVEVLKTRE